MESPSGPRLQPNQLYLYLASYAIGYYVAERTLRFAFSRLCPRMHDDLLKRGKAAPFFGLALGFITTLISTPACYRAFTQLSTKATIDFAHPGAAEVCFATRSILWLEQLSPLCDNTPYLFHHAMSLFSAVYILHYSLPCAKYFCAILGSLVTELGTGATGMLAYCGFKTVDHQWIWWLECLNVISTVAVRAPAVFMLCFSSWYHGLPLMQQIVWVTPTALYAAYQIYVMRARLQRLRAGWTVTKP